MKIFDLSSLEQSSVTDTETNELMAMLSLIEITSGRELCAVLLVGKCCWAASSEAPGVSSCAQSTSLARESSGGEVMALFFVFLREDSCSRKLSLC